jgi:hypothetical protein
MTRRPEQQTTVLEAAESLEMVVLHVGRRGRRSVERSEAEAW